MSDTVSTKIQINGPKLVQMYRNMHGLGNKQGNFRLYFHYELKIANAADKVYYT